MDMSYLEIKDMSCGYHNGFFVSDINLSLPKGAFLGIIGRNGSGKSTFFRGIAADLPLSGGEVVVGGVNLAGVGLRGLARLIAVVPQFTELSGVSVQEYVLMGRIAHRRPFQFSYTEADRAVAAKYIELMGITHLKDKPVTEISGGEQQMAAVACALTQQPTLLLLDEPTSHLDITYQVRIMNLLEELSRSEGITIMMIVHDLNLAGEYCTHLMLMSEGKSLCQGAATEVLTRENIERAYRTRVEVGLNPVSKRPFIFPLSGRVTV